MKEAEFHREPAKGEADEEKGEEGIQEKLPVRHRSSLEPRRHPLKLARMTAEPLWDERTIYSTMHLPGLRFSTFVKHRGTQTPGGGSATSRALEAPWKSKLVVLVQTLGSSEQA